MTPGVRPGIESFTGFVYSSPFNQIKYMHVGSAAAEKWMVTQAA